MEAVDGKLDLLFDGLDRVDPDVDALVGMEEVRQSDKIILIPSESIAPRAVRQTLGTVFTNIYAEGYPSLRMTKDEQQMLLEFAQQLALHRRYADRRYYKGTEFANFVEALAQRRVAALFASDRDSPAGVRVRAEQIFANVQPLSGAAANNAVYEALLQPGDVVLGMSLVAGGHLTHGSPLNRSGKYYNVVSYSVSKATGRLDYAEIAALARQHRPRLIIAGGSAYPWDIDWEKLRAIADEVPGRAYLLADIAHPAGLVVAGLFPNPVGLADVVTFTTHKTMLGPRAAAILSTDEAIASRIDRAVFPGEQGGPHVNAIAAMAVAFKLAQTPQFRRVQEQTVANAQTLAATLQRLGLRLAYGGTNTHLLLVDLNGVKTASGYPLKGDVAARILDVCGIVCNKNTIPGDTSAADASAIRLGATWVTQRGFGQAETERLGELIQQAISGIRTFRYFGPTGDLARGKLPFATMQAIKEGVAALVQQAPPQPDRRLGAPDPGLGPGGVSDVVAAAQAAGMPLARRRLLQVTGERAFLFLQAAASANLAGLAPGQWQTAALLNEEGQAIDEVIVLRLAPDQLARERYLVAPAVENASKVKAWLAALSDGYVLCDRGDVYAKVDGPVVVQEIDGAELAQVAAGDGGAPVEVAPVEISKPFFVGQRAIRAALPLPAASKKDFTYAPYEGEPRQTSLYAEHRKLTAQRNMIPFAGWSMPVWYTSIGEEHRAVREAAGLFDIAHMGVLEVSGPGATRLLDLVTSNYVPLLSPGQGQYSYVLDPTGGVLDDIFVYRRAPERYMVVVNAANAEKITAWLAAVNSREYVIDPTAADREVDVTPQIRDLKDPAAGADQRVDLALQGPQSWRILREQVDPALQAAVAALPRASFVEGQVGGTAALIARTGYTGAEVGFELYVHPDEAPRLWRLLLERGQQYGLKPAGLGARDSLRTEAGFPLYGHELAGVHDISPSGAGYGAFVKLHKAFFVGKAGFQQREAARKQEVVRFRMNARGIRMVRPGDPVVSKRGEVVGAVTSCAVVEGTQLGMAYVNKSYSREGTILGIFILPREEKAPPEKGKRELSLGDRVLLHEEATVISRFLVGQPGS